MESRCLSSFSYAGLIVWLKSDCFACCLQKHPPNLYQLYGHSFGVQTKPPLTLSWSLMRHSFPANHQISSFQWRRHQASKSSIARDAMRCLPSLARFQIVARPPLSSPYLPRLAVNLVDCCLSLALLQTCQRIGSRTSSTLMPYTLPLLLSMLSCVY